MQGEMSPGEFSWTDRRLKLLHRRVTKLSATSDVISLYCVLSIKCKRFLCSSKTTLSLVHEAAGADPGAVIWFQDATKVAKSVPNL